MTGVYKNRQLMPGGGGGGMGPAEYAQLTAGGAENIIGIYQFIDGQNKERALLGKPPITYKEAVEMFLSRNRANTMAKAGFTPAENAAFFQSMARYSNQNYNTATQVGGGGLASTVNAGIGYNKLGALNTHASNDASLHRQNIQYADVFSRNMQMIENMNTQNKYNEFQTDLDLARKEKIGGVATFVNGFATAGGSGADMSAMQPEDKKIVNNAQPTNQPSTNLLYQQQYGEQQQREDEAGYTPQYSLYDFYARNYYNEK